MHICVLQLCVSVSDPVQFLSLIMLLLHCRVLISFPPPQVAVHGSKLLHSIHCGSIKVKDRLKTNSFGNYDIFLLTLATPIKHSILQINILSQMYHSSL